MSADFAAVAVFGVLCGRTELYETVIKAGCSHKVAPGYAFCPQCGAQAEREYEQPISGFDKNEKLVVGEYTFDVFGLNPQCDMYIVGKFLRRVSAPNSPIIVDFAARDVVLSSDEIDALRKLGLANGRQDLKLWLVLEGCC